MHRPSEPRRPSSCTSGSTMGYSAMGSENGQSSTAGSQRSSDNTLQEALSGPGKDAALQSTDVTKRSSHRSHRSRNSGAFLLSGPVFTEPEASAGAASHQQMKAVSDRKGKSPMRTPNKRHTKERSNVGLGIGGSPLATNVSSFRADVYGDPSVAQRDVITPDRPQEKTSSGFDVDYTQIVNLALNLSESRKNAARRNTSAPLPSLASTFGEGFAGGSLRQHLQQQRRVSRNVSPKPLRVSTASPRTASGQVPSPIHSSFDQRASESYQYQFSTSTLARAEKARTQIELMAQYRRLLQYLSPLKPDQSAGSSIPTTSRDGLVTGTLGRPYNPLQYIRNRKIRARERKTIDGEAQGFGDIDKVATWVDQVSSSDGATSADCSIMPIFSKAAEEAASPRISSPKQSLVGKISATQAKTKRPRIDWDTNPADMLADLFWTEQDDNRKIVEDRFGRKVFPPNLGLNRATSGKREAPEARESLDIKKSASPHLRLDTKFPEFKSVKAIADKHDSATDKVKHKLRDATRVHHNGVREPRQFLQSRSKSDSDSSDTDYAQQSHNRRNGSPEPHDLGVDILNKQMKELLEKEARGGTRKDSLNLKSPSIRECIDQERATSKDAVYRFRDSLDDTHSTSGSMVANADTRPKRHSIVSSERQSLDVPGGNGRSSLEVPDSAVSYAGRDTNLPLRRASPSRNPLAKVRSKMNPFDHDRTHSRGRAATAAHPVVSALTSSEYTLDSVEATERPRSMSPIRKAIPRHGVESGKTSRRGSFRKGKTSEDASGIRGLFKGRRGPVAAVSDMIWKKDTTNVALGSGFSTDESDLDDSRNYTDMEKGSRDSSVEPVEIRKDLPRMNGIPSYDLPIFTSRAQRERSAEPDTSQISSDDREAHEKRHRNSRAQLLDTPRIDIHSASPGSSPEVTADDLRSDPSVSLAAQKGNHGVSHADARLNEVLSICRRRGSQWSASHLLMEDSDVKRPTMEGKRQWSISDRGVSVQGPMTKREIARVRALLLSSGIKAKEISRRADEMQDLHLSHESIYQGITALAQHRVKPMPKHQMHMVAAGILSDDIELSKRIWRDSADTFCHNTVQDLVIRLEQLKGTLQDNLAPMARKAADDADEASKDLVVKQTQKVKTVADIIDEMNRRRRRKFRWLRRGGWVLVEWSLVTIMYFTWLIVICWKIFTGTWRFIGGAIRWLLFL
ncbi:hypothetical protein BJ878DRAFT_492099 [Calycina marina]|uniref:Uncharacterized protein n=1 Tax=Calycina marina TaxID=1763456 RepID=A0A9P7Z9R8_9HELO|nr:hypothetical protein BJ878DRAFT_492099 [Calycina marina]